MQKPIVVERFADNGEHSHWELIDSSTGETLWEQQEPLQLLQQTPCTTQLLPPDKIWLLKEIAHPYIYETAEEGTYSIATQGIEKILESYERIRQQLS